jgi:hypothetical protein
MAEPKLVIPEASKLMPPAMQKKWKATYAEAFEEAKASGQGAESDWHQAARCEANRLLKVPVPKTYEDAMALPDWQCVLRKTEGGVLKLVTIDGRKYTFDVPKKAQSTPPPNTPSA